MTTIDSPRGLKIKLLTQAYNRWLRSQSSEAIDLEMDYAFWSKDFYYLLEKHLNGSFSKTSKENEAAPFTLEQIEASLKRANKLLKEIEDKEAQTSVNERSYEEGRRSLLPVDKSTRRRVRNGNNSLFSKPRLLSPYSSWKKVSKIQREELQRTVQVSQLPSQPLPRTVHSLVDKKVRDGGVRKADRRK